MAPAQASGASPPERSGADLLRFAAIGSVDDGKSTLIGRLLVDSRQLFDDQLDALDKASRRRGISQVELAFVTDGLKAEREQGITIDVAYRYAATPQRKYVIADCPGHVQYTANMATGASTADLALVVVDVTAGLKEQTRRHVAIASLLGVDQMLVAANKMDLARWEKAAYLRTTEQMSDLAQRLSISSHCVVPVSALAGDNVVATTASAPWYEGPSILECLQEAPAGGWAAAHSADGASRLAVQWVLRETARRAYAGVVGGAPLHRGDSVVVLPSGRASSISSISTYDGDLEEAPVGISVAVELTDDIDVSRGDLIASAAEPPLVTTELQATVCWFGARPLEQGARLALKHTTRTSPVRVQEVLGRFDVNKLEMSEAESIQDNEIGVVSLTTGTPLAVDPYHSNRVTGSFVLVDPATHATLAACMVGTPLLSRPSPLR
ncbi:MAG: sulfate adenylyltransferase subunit 1 [Acidimicrobiales bacterium]